MPFINNYQMALNYLGFIKYKASTHTHTLWELIISIELLEWLFQSLLDVCHFPTDAEPTELRWARTQTREWKSHLHLVHMSVQSTDLAVPIPWILYISLSLWISMWLHAEDWIYWVLAGAENMLKMWKICKRKPQIARLISRQIARIGCLAVLSL